ncbi:MAG: aldehyde dehydrogenase family protein [Akkermansiaceae bacterium]|nr:aldehyde dehydrogenase family protein [Akkermansiaceae bacterium]
MRTDPQKNFPNNRIRFRAIILFVGLLLLPAGARPPASAAPTLQKRWLFIWRDMNDAKEVDRVIARLPRAKVAGYNGIALSPNMRPAKAAEFREAARVNGLDIVANQGEVCTCPSRALIQESVYDKFMERVLPRVAAIKQGNPLDTETMIGAQASEVQMTKIESYLELGKQEGAQLLAGGARAHLSGDVADGYYIQPTLFKGHNKMRFFQEEIFGPVLAVTTFKDEADALAIANDTSYGLGAGVWSRNGNVAYRMGRGIKAGRVWTNCYHAYPAHAAFGGYKESGIGRETHQMMLGHYQHTKNLLVSYSPKKLGFF